MRRRRSRADVIPTYLVPLPNLLLLFRRADAAKIHSDGVICELKTEFGCRFAVAATQGVSGTWQERKGQRHLSVAATSALLSTSNRQISLHAAASRLGICPDLDIPDPSNSGCDFDNYVFGANLMT